MLTKRINPKTKRKEWCLVSRNGLKVLEYYGKVKPSEDHVQKTESRVGYFKQKHVKE